MPANTTRKGDSAQHHKALNDVVDEELDFDYSRYRFKRLGTPLSSSDNLRALAKAEAQKDYESVERRMHLPNEEGLKHLQATSDVVAPKFHKLLVANRGEIAMRIIRTAHEVGLKTVAIYAHEDRLTMHRYKADESYEIAPEGKYSPVGAYLAQDEILAIAKARNCDVIHPGYGFLSENAEFARKVEEAGIRWVGPTFKTIDNLGDKVKARKIAIECEVPVVPGTKEPTESPADAEAFVSEHGLPIIIKAAMGGGGRGMRVVRKKEDLATSFERAQSEAKAAFGDGTVFIERFLDKPKHIEVQLLGDGHGNVIHSV